MTGPSPTPTAMLQRRLPDHLRDYLALRRGLGYRLRQEGRLLGDFVDYLDRQGLDRVTIEAAVAWATLPAGASPAWWARRLGIVRDFARYLKTLQPETQIPPNRLFPRGVSRIRPYLYSPEQITGLMAAAGQLAHPLRAATFRTLIGLLAVTGLRPGEAMRLDRDDVDLHDPDAAALTIRRSKNGATRQVPLHSTTAAALARYAADRDRLCPAPSTTAFFLSGAGTRLNHTNASTSFVSLLAAAGITPPPGRRPARLYDLRHTFAVTTLTDWYGDGADVQSRLPLLSAYLGHTKPSSTYWYYSDSRIMPILIRGRGICPGQRGRSGFKVRDNPVRPRHDGVPAGRDPRGRDCRGPAKAPVHG
jgi:integrase/recombinase XerD